MVDPNENRKGIVMRRRLPSQVAQEYGDMDAPPQIIEKLIDCGVYNGGGTLLDCVIGGAYVRALAGSEGHLKVVLTLLQEAKEDMGVSEGIGVDVEKDAQIVALFDGRIALLADNKRNGKSGGTKMAKEGSS